MYEEHSVEELAVGGSTELFAQFPGRSTVNSNIHLTQKFIWWQYFRV
jgi:hypothetical protein